MPYVHIKVTREGGPDGNGPSPQQKQLLIEGVTGLLKTVLNKAPASTFVVIDEVPLDNWGIAGRRVTEIRANGS
ncbi:MAG: 4-oxalocrotonate tautomerase family protein [Pseudomonadota bacterium]